MRWLPERFYEQLSRCRAHRSGENRNRPQPSALSTKEEVEPLTTLARRLQKATPMQVDAHFADLLEKQLLASTARQALFKQATKRACWKQGFRFSPMKFTTMSLSTRMALCCLFVLCLGTGVLVTGSLPLPQKTALASTRQIELTEHAAHAQLLTLANLADPAHAQAYRGELAKLDQQIDDCAHEVETVPEKSGWQHANHELIELKTDARQALYRFLPGLALPERVLTTSELGKLGATVPVVRSASFTLNATKNQATVFLQGSGIMPGAHLLLDTQEIPVSGVIQNGGYQITIPWSAQSPLPQHLGILNTNHTAAQTSTLTVQTTQNSGNTGGDDGGGHKGRGGGSDSSPGGGPSSGQGRDG